MQTHGHARTLARGNAAMQNGKEKNMIRAVRRGKGWPQMNRVNHSK